MELNITEALLNANNPIQEIRNNADNFLFNIAFLIPEEVLPYLLKIIKIQKTDLDLLGAIYLNKHITKKYKYDLFFASLFS